MGNAKMPSHYFRAGVGAVIVNGDGCVLGLERADVPGAWQLPQGGLDGSEEPIEAALREIAEETGIAASALQLLQTCPEPLAYELPPAMRSPKTGRGQAQYWFLFRFRAREDVIDVTAGREFRSWQWMPLDRLIELTVAFRKPVYQRLADHFRSHLARTAPVD
jgi:putative (di)nucleoside polyphosphate hydrolase